MLELEHNTFTGRTSIRFRGREVENRMLGKLAGAGAVLMGLFAVLLGLFSVLHGLFAVVVGLLLDVPLKLIGCRGCVSHDFDGTLSVHLSTSSFRRA